MNPLFFREIIPLIESSKKSSGIVSARFDTIPDARMWIDQSLNTLSFLEKELTEEIKRSSIRKNPYASLEAQRQEADSKASLGLNFILVSLDIFTILSNSLTEVERIVNGLHNPGELILPNDFDDQDLSFEGLQRTSSIFSMNENIINEYISLINRVAGLESFLSSKIERLYRVWTGYYNKLTKRHRDEGYPIFHNPVITDIAICVLENVDGHGEIERREEDHLTSHSAVKATGMIRALEDSLANTFAREPHVFISNVLDILKDLCELSGDLQSSMNEDMKKVFSIIIKPFPKNSHLNRDRTFYLDRIEKTDPCEIELTSKNEIKSRGEMFLEKFRNETLGRIVDHLMKEHGSHKLFCYIMDRKKELKKYFEQENSFFVCQVGAGNPFLGISPGSLHVIPGEKPVAKMDELKGTGFPEIIKFFEQIDKSSRWSSLYAATSPSRRPDKANALLIGPQGCGKSEFLRAVGADPSSISIFAQGSDFLTCWSGESDKNPKRMFEEGVKLAKSSKKRVHFLIDEIDAVLNEDKEYGSKNLTLEFQQLMDGVVHYPNISMWGATNSPWRIPVPMIRRFHLVCIVGELTSDHRSQLLKHFMEFLPLRGFDENHWIESAEKLCGATGDVIRKIADTVWRKSLDHFTSNYPEKADEMIAWLNSEEKFDVHTFPTEKRSILHQMMENVFVVTPKDLQEAIEENLANLAIQHEIAMARACYEESHLYLKGISKQ